VISPFVVPPAARASDPLVTRYGSVLRTFNPALSAAQSQDMATHVLLMSSYYSLDPRLLVAIVGVESSWRTGAVSSSGAQGLGQLMPATASGLGVVSADAYENLDGTARYLRRMVQQSNAADADARYRLALASYNAGPQAVARFRGVPPFAETQAYVAKVMMLWHNLKATLPSATDAVALIARAPAHLAARLPKRARHSATVAPLPAGSVAEFSELDADSMEAYRADAPAAPKKTLGRWLARAFGGGR
jgi:hypothetical protein